MPILLLPVLLKTQHMHSQGATQLTEVSHRIKKAVPPFDLHLHLEVLPCTIKKTKKHSKLCVTLMTISSQPLSGVLSFYPKCRIIVKFIGMVGRLFGFGPAPSRHKCAGHYRSANVEQLTNSQIFQATQANCLYFPFEEIKIRVLRSPCCSKFCYFVVDVPCLHIPVLN